MCCDIGLFVWRLVCRWHVEHCSKTAHWVCVWCETQRVFVPLSDFQVIFCSASSSWSFCTCLTGRGAACCRTPVSLLADSVRGLHSSDLSLCWQTLSEDYTVLTYEMLTAAETGNLSPLLHRLGHAPLLDYLDSKYRLWRHPLLRARTPPPPHTHHNLYLWGRGGGSIRKSYGDLIQKVCKLKIYHEVVPVVATTEPLKLSKVSQSNYITKQMVRLWLKERWNRNVRITQCYFIGADKYITVYPTCV